MATLQWIAPTALATLLTTELDNLATSTTDTTGFSGLSAEIDNEAGLYEYLDLELLVNTQASARGAGGSVAILVAYAVDPANYPDASIGALTTPVTSFGLDATVTARRLTRTNLPLAPFKFKLQVWNKTGYAFAASGSTLKYRLHDEGA